MNHIYFILNYIYIDEIFRKKVKLVSIFEREHTMDRETAYYKFYLLASQHNQSIYFKDTRVDHETKVTNVLLIRKFLCFTFAIGQIYVT